MIPESILHSGTVSAFISISISLALWGETLFFSGIGD